MGAIRFTPLGLSFYFTCDDGTDELSELSDLYTTEGLSHDAQFALVEDPTRPEEMKASLKAIKGHY